MLTFFKTDTLVIEEMTGSRSPNIGKKNAHKQEKVSSHFLCIAVHEQLKISRLRAKKHHVCA